LHEMLPSLRNKKPNPQDENKSRENGSTRFGTLSSTGG
jgi:hypothetical protein